MTAVICLPLRKAALFLSCLIVPTAQCMVEKQGSTEQEEINIELFIACDLGDLEAVQSLLVKRAAVNCAYSFKRLADDTLHMGTPLGQAAQNGHWQIMELLLQNGADVRIKSPVTGIEPLTLAAVEGCVQAVLTLLRWNADPNCSESFGGSPLIAAAEHGRLAVAKRLLNARAALDTQTKDAAVTALIQAAQNGHGLIVDLLIKAKADINRARADGSTALHRAVDENRVGVVKSLLGANANKNALDGDNKLPAHYARSADMKRIIKK